MEISLNLIWVGSVYPKFSVVFYHIQITELLRRHSTSVLLVFLNLILRFVFICSIKTNEEEL